MSNRGSARGNNGRRTETYTATKKSPREFRADGTGLDLFESSLFFLRVLVGVVLSFGALTLLESRSSAYKGDIGMIYGEHGQVGVSTSERRRSNANSNWVVGRDAAAARGLLFSSPSFPLSQVIPQPSSPTTTTTTSSFVVLLFFIISID